MLKLQHVVSSVLLVLASSPAPAAEAPLALPFTAPRLEWGACPDFIPQGCELTVLHGDPAQANADVFLKVPPNFTIPDHWHTSAERMVLVSGELHVTYEGQPTAVLKPGMYAYGPARLAHRAVCESAAPCVLFIAFEAPVDAVAGKAGNE